MKESLISGVKGRVAQRNPSSRKPLKIIKNIKIKATVSCVRFSIWADLMTYLLAIASKIPIMISTPNRSSKKSSARCSEEGSIKSRPTDSLRVMNAKKVRRRRIKPIEIPKKTDHRIRLVLKILFSKITSVIIDLSTVPHLSFPLKLELLPNLQSIRLFVMPTKKITSERAVMSQNIFHL